MKMESTKEKGLETGFLVCFYVQKKRKEKEREKRKEKKRKKKKAKQQ